MPYNGKWMMQDQNKRQLKFCDGKPLEAWGILDLARTNSAVMDSFITCLQQEGGLRDLKISVPAMIEKSDEDHLEEDFKWFFEQIKTKVGRKPGKIFANKRIPSSKAAVVCFFHSFWRLLHVQKNFENVWRSTFD